MKRRTIFSVILLISIALLLAISCSPDADINKGDRLILISNVDENGNPTTRSVEGVLDNLKIHDVLLKYHFEGLYNEDSCFKYLYDSENNQFEYPNAFYLEYLGEDQKTDYGMTFNYVLYVPNIIPKIYKEGNGINPLSGNPFWWYMKTYYNKDLNMITNDWPSALWQLFLNKDGLVIPNSKDVAGF